jgi:hypothetical protein
MSVTVAGPAPRTKKVVTETTEEVPITEKSKYEGIGMPWQDFCAELTDATLAAITDIYIYRIDPNGRSVFQIKTHEPIDEEWIGNKFGGGTYNIKLYRKPNISHFERNVILEGPPKPAVPAPAAADTSTANGDMARVIGLLEKTIERLDQKNTPAPAPDPTKQADAASTMADATKKLVEAAVAARPELPAKSPLDTVEGLLSVIDKLRPPTPRENGFDLDLDRLKKLREIMAPPAGAAQQSNVLDQVTTLSKLADLIDKFRGGGEVDWRTALITTIGEKAPEIVGQIKDILQANAQATEARARAATAIAATRTHIPQPPVIPPAPPANTAATPRPQPVPAPSPTWGGPVEFETTAAPAGPGMPPNAPPPEILSELQIADRVFKRRLVELVREDADPAMLLAVIDGMAPAMAALLARATDEQVRQVIVGDPILQEITRFPHYEKYMGELLAELRRPEETTN